MVNRTSDSLWLFSARCIRPVKVDKGRVGGTSRGDMVYFGVSSRFAGGGEKDELNRLQQGGEGEGGEFGGHGVAFGGGGVSPSPLWGGVGGAWRKAAPHPGPPHKGEGGEG